MRMKPDDRRKRGQLGEAYAEQWLINKGYKIRERNWRCRSGEIDIIAELGGVVAFIEVRARSQVSRFGTPAESVDARKQRQVRLTAQIYLQGKRMQDRPLRFDVVAVLLNPDSTLKQIDHYENAF